MPSTALADPGFSSQVAELRHDRRPNSAKQQTSRRAFHRAPGLMPPIVEPSPQHGWGLGDTLVFEVAERLPRLSTMDCTYESAIIQTVASSGSCSEHT
ncbi:hypothetical protein AAP_02244 [Ascosphaera apis ARSEF 7405]|uniref:Uncharacterized protein n=1 Tax=Ascosphaera apis ARSEF 7405 TaxID=392613 RepID=A0A168A4B6_9EURO|nr:hypothetical protein AAP_02244 [Ascosphaera apis ARSEF 7405]